MKNIPCMIKTAGTIFCLLVAMTALILLAGQSPSHAAAIVINEFLADPGPGLTGDANGDGIRGTSDDEFIELVNTSGSSIDLTDWTLSDLVGVRHHFPAGTVLDPYAAIVVFGGGTPTGDFGGALVQTASTGTLSLNNTSETITLKNGAIVIATISYGAEGGDDQSLTLDPDITGTGFLKHSLATGSGGALFSPGTMVDGTPFAATVPIPGAALLLGSGLTLLGGLQRKNRN